VPAVRAGALWSGNLNQKEDMILEGHILIGVIFYGVCFEQEKTSPCLQITMHNLKL
jgi:hypothetical protein